jgi:hypothetical protein
MHKIKSLISDAIRNKNTLIAEHCYCEVIKDPITLEVYPYKLDGDFLICYDLKVGQPYVINLHYVKNITHGKRKNIDVPKYLWMDN